MQGVRIAAGVALAGAAGMALAADQLPPQRPVYATGALPIDPGAYDQLPKVAKFRAFLPKTVDLSATFPKPGYQGQQSACVAWATTYASRSYFQGMTLGHRPSVPAELMSPAYVYNRLRRPGTQCNVPIRLIDALTLLTNEGTVTDAEFPTDLTKCNIPAPAVLQAKAGQYKLGGWRAISKEANGQMSLDDIKGALVQSQPVVFTLPAMQDFYDLKGDAIYHHATTETENLHAMSIIGYDEDRQAFRVINSWGDYWADKGYAWIDYGTFKLMVREAYALTGPGGQSKVAEPELSAGEKLDALIAKAPCAAIGKLRGGHLRLSGFTGSREAIAQIEQAARGVDPKAEVAIAWHPWPQCEAELTLAKALAGSKVTLAATDAGGAARAGEPVGMHSGELFGVTVRTTPELPYVSVVYLQADGSAVELYRGTPGGPDRSVTIGTQGATQARFEVGPPYGDEMVIALASKAPLFGAEMTTYATERQFLTGMRAKLTTVAPGAAAAAVLRLRTAG